MLQKKNVPFSTVSRVVNWNRGQAMFDNAVISKNLRPKQTELKHVQIFLIKVHEKFLCLLMRGLLLVAEVDRRNS